MDRLATRFFSSTKNTPAIVILMCADAVAIVSAMFISLALRFDTLSIPQLYTQYMQHHLKSLPVVLLFYVLILSAYRLYRYAWRFASMEMIWGVVYASAIGFGGLIVFQKLLDESEPFPRPVLIIFLLVSTVLIGAVRIFLRFANLGRSYGSRALRVLRRDTCPKRVVILGGGADGARLVATLREDTQESYDIIGFLDDQPSKEGIYIRGVQVIGPLNHLYELLEKQAVDEVLVAIPDGGGSDIRDYVMACRRQKVPVKLMPGLQDMLNGNIHSRLEEISVEDLLRRPTRRIRAVAVGNYLSGKRVLVTGAGGSIGSELCRQLLKCDPAELVLFGHGENSIHQIHQALVRARPDLADRLHIVVGSVSDDVRVDQIFRVHRPQFVFHAAAHKHVPIMEMNVQEAVQNNVLGTRCIANACGHYGVETMVLISTDKAVYPSCVMGATKWLCEEVVRAMANQYPDSTFVTVRFGNVLGSRGSVVPIFRKQIEDGGPITITHPNVTRYFMTIPEAVQLVLQASVVGKSGELYVLDMGEPVKILDLAQDMIRLSGYEPNVDIPIVFTGLRPGEKMHELLVSEEELLNPTPYEGLSIVHRREYFTPVEMQSVVRRLQQLASTGDGEQVLDYLGEVVPAFASQRLLAEAMSAIDASEVAVRP